MEEQRSANKPDSRACCAACMYAVLYDSFPFFFFTESRWECLLTCNSQALIELAELYFAIPQPRSQAANPLGDMISAMLGGGGPPTAAPARRILSPPPASGSPGLD